MMAWQKIEDMFMKKWWSGKQNRMARREARININLIVS